MIFNGMDIFKVSKNTLRNKYMDYLQFLDINKLIKARSEMLKENKAVICEIDAPMVFGAKGKIVYEFTPKD